MIKSGYFEVDNPKYPGEEVYQVSDADNLIEIDTGLTQTPERLICIYIDERIAVNNGVTMFSGCSIANSYYVEKANVQGMIENIGFTDSNATYMRYEEVSGKIYLHVKQWAYMKAGQWMWIAIYAE